jgi:hypothetical protein
MLLESEETSGERANEYRGCVDTQVTTKKKSKLSSCEAATNRDSNAIQLKQTKCDTVLHHNGTPSSPHSSSTSAISAYFLEVVPPFSQYGIEALKDTIQVSRKHSKRVPRSVSRTSQCVAARCSEHVPSSPLASLLAIPNPRPCLLHADAARLSIVNNTSIPRKLIISILVD